MRRTLRLHPQSRCAARIRIEVDIERRSGELALCYRVTGATSELYLPAPAAAARTDELWRRTCFEAFVRVSPAPGYLEFNFSPSTQWAAYRFIGYRDGVTIADDVATPSFESRTDDEGYELRANLALDQRADGTEADVWRLGLSAVIEETNGHKSYWALAHPPGKADFHHDDCFALELAAPGRS